MLSLEIQKYHTIVVDTILIEDIFPILLLEKLSEKYLDCKLRYRTWISDMNLKIFSTFIFHICISQKEVRIYAHKQNLVNSCFFDKL